MANPNIENPHDRHLKPSRLPRWVQYVGVAAFVVIIIASGVYSATEHWRRATTALGTGMVWLTVLRLTCDSKVLGVLAVRSRTFDAIFTAVVGAVLLFLSLSVDALGS